MSVFDRDKWQEIFGTMRKHKLRTALTALGVFWGIFLLVFALGMGAGLQNGVYKGFGDRAKNIMWVWSSNTTKPYKGFQAGRRPKFTLEDIYAIQNQVPEVKYIAPRTNIGNAFVSHNGNSDSYEVRGEMTDMIHVEALQLHEGRYINDLDLEQSRKVAVIGKRIKEVLFDDEDCIGKSIQIKGIQFRVVGVFGPIQVKPWTESDLQSVVIPITTMERTFGTGGRIGFFICGAEPNIKVSEMEPKIHAVLKNRHQIAPDDPEGVGGFNLEEEFMSVRNLFLGINGMLWFVGIGTLLAGIVGVSNIMLIIVKERTKEIGIRKAMGATPGSIVSLILTESIFLTSVSGYLGLMVATLIIGGIDYVMIANELEPDNFYHPEVDMWTGIGAVVMLVVAGTIAGLIPALQAANVRPVVALQDE